MHLGVFLKIYIYGYHTRGSLGIPIFGDPKLLFLIKKNKNKNETHLYWFPFSSLLSVPTTTSTSSLCPVVAGTTLFSLLLIPLYFIICDLLFTVVDLLTIALSIF